MCIGKRILIAPLDWGLGHTTRCIPIIRFLLENGHEPLLAGSEGQLRYLQKSFEHLQQVFLPSYDIRYGNNGLFTKIALASGSLKVIKRIKEEQQIIQSLVRKGSIDAIISDNRYGCFHPELSSVLITHQLHIQTGLGRAADAIAAIQNGKWQRNFKEIWTVDIPEMEHSLAGDLSHPPVEKARYIGWLSPLAGTDRSGPNQHILILISGPEPQRSQWSDELWNWALSQSAPIVFIEGSEVTRMDVPPHIQHFGRIGSDELGPLLSEAQAVIARSGYSSLMDILALQKTAFIAPTSGQAEQEYLARWLDGKYVFHRWQRDLIIAPDREDSSPPLEIPENAFHLFKPVVHNWLQLI